MYSIILAKIFSYDFIRSFIAIIENFLLFMHDADQFVINFIVFCLPFMHFSHTNIVEFRSQWARSYFTHQNSIFGNGKVVQMVIEVDDAGNLFNAFNHNKIVIN